MVINKLAQAPKKKRNSHKKIPFQVCGSKQAKNFSLKGKTKTIFLQQLILAKKRARFMSYY